MSRRILERCASMPVRRLDPGDVLIVEGERSGLMHVVVDGSFAVSQGDAILPTIVEPGVVLGELSVLLDIPHTATVTATVPSSVVSIAEPLAFVSEDTESLLELTRLLARRVHRLTAYLDDLRVQYGDSGGHLGMVDAILKELSAGDLPEIDSGSEREPDPYS
ncbi:MAG: cyclic nucleotide-binding domain-containing protein [Acidimicrobiales bacterium]